MAVIGKKMDSYKTMTKPLYTSYSVPPRVQETVPIARIAKDGIFQLEEVEKGPKLYDKAYLFLDTNFSTMDDREKKNFLKLYCAMLNSLNIDFKIVIMNNTRNMEVVREEVFMKRADGKFKSLLDSYNKHIENCLTKGSSGIEQVRLFVLSCRRENDQQARDFFRSIESNLIVNFDRMESALIPLNAEERLRYLHDFYHMGAPAHYTFDFDRAFQKKQDWKDTILPSFIKYHQNEYGVLDGTTLQIGTHFCRALCMPQMPNAIDPEIIKKLMGGSFHMILTIDVAAIPQDVAKKHLSDLYLENARSIEKQQEERNKAGAWSSDVSYDKRRERDELENYMDIINNNDEKMFYTGIYAVIAASNMSDLESDVVAFQNTAEGEGFIFDPVYYQQIEAINTALPIGCRYCENMQAIFTQPLCALTPFIVHELYEPHGIFYGINQISKNVLVGNRKNLKNGNGFTLGVTGGGKSVDVKQELVQVFLGTQDDIIVIDPQNEYRSIAEYLSGEFIDFNAESNHHINPLDADTMNYMDSTRTFLQDKTELMCSIFSQITDYGVEAQEKSIIGRVTNKVYEHLGERGFRSPTLVDFYNGLKEEPEVQARQLSLAMELFVTGNLDMFSQQTNVNINNRLTIYGIADLGKEQAAVGMLIMLESIRSRIAENARKGKATWLYIDEFHNLASQEFSAKYLEKIWKEVRKLGGLCTAITQNIADLLASKTIETMLCNSEYLSLLTQSEVEIDILHRLLNISNNLLEYVKNVPRGCGLLKFGDKIIPKDARLPKDSVMYELFNTNFHEIQAMKKRDLAREVQRLPELTKEEVENNPLPSELLFEDEETPV